MDTDDVVILLEQSGVAENTVDMENLAKTVISVIGNNVLNIIFAILELKKWLSQLAADEMKDPTRYRDSGMLFRLPNGLAVEPVLIRKKFLKWQDAHPEFPRIVFHGLRHSSATYQLMISGGDVKAVQGTTGHATADMLVNTYAHIQQSSRVELGRKFEEGFYAKSENPSPQAVPAEGEPTISMTALLELLKNADPEVKAQLRLALLT